MVWIVGRLFKLRSWNSIFLRDFRSLDLREIACGRSLLLFSGLRFHAFWNLGTCGSGIVIEDLGFGGDKGSKPKLNLRLLF